MISAILDGTRKRSPRVKRLLERDSGDNTEINDRRNTYQVVPHEGEVDELYHVHSLYSDGLNTFDSMVAEALYLGLDLGFMDHLDLTEISGQVHQGPWAGNFSDNIEYRKESLEEYIEDLDSDVPEDRAHAISIGRGAEIDWDPRESRRGLLRGGIQRYEFDYTGLSVHHDRDGVPIKSSKITEGSNVVRKVEEYVEELVRAAEFAEDVGVDVLCHPARAEEGDLEHGFTPETYEPVLETLSDSSVAYEINTKVYLRYLLNNGVLPAQLETPEDYLDELPAEFEALANYDGELPDISIGTDTHRLGHSSSFEGDYMAIRDLDFPQLENGVGPKLTESQARTWLGEQISEVLSELREEEVKPVSILGDKELETVTVDKEKYDGGVTIQNPI